MKDTEVSLKSYRSECETALLSNGKKVVAPYSIFINNKVRISRVPKEFIGIIKFR